jgi:hypothetical protein
VNESRRHDNSDGTPGREQGLKGAPKDLKLWDRTALVTGSDGIDGTVAKVQSRHGIAEVRSRRRTMGALVFVVALVLLAAFHGGTSGPWVVTAAEGDRFSEYVDGKGNISLPADYETRFVHLGTFSVKTKAVGPKDELHGVYAQPEDVAAFKRDGRFPDGAVFVKPVYESKTEALTTGDASWATNVKVWFVMIEDSQGRFKGNNL